jgi:hypothetical protein
LNLPQAVSNLHAEELTNDEISVIVHGAQLEEDEISVTKHGAQCSKENQGGQTLNGKGCRPRIK